MKAIIYAGIGLFSVAAVYGLADYYNSQKKGALDNLYKEDPAPRETAITESKSNLIRENKPEPQQAINNTALKIGRKTKVPKRTVRLEEFSRAKIEEPLPAEIIARAEPDKATLKKTGSEPMIQPAVHKDDAKPETVREVEKTESRKLSLDMFSRAPLRKPVKKNN
jgi:hypothetical protein